MIGPATGQRKDVFGKTLTVDNGYTDIPVTSMHVLPIHHLPPIHRDPFDRLLVAQAESEGVLLLTTD